MSISRLCFCHQAYLHEVLQEIKQAAALQFVHVRNFKLVALGPSLHVIGKAADRQQLQQSYAHVAHLTRTVSCCTISSKPDSSLHSP